MLCRSRKNRVKGRDFYDLVWYMARETPVDLRHLKARMVQTGQWNEDETLDLAALRERLVARFGEVEFALAKEDVRPFLRDVSALELWSEEFFIGLLPRLEAT